MSNLDVIKRETMLQTTNAWIKRLSSFATSNDLQFDKYQENIVVNTVRKIIESGYDIYAFEQNNVADILYQTAFLRLNPSATPRHCYFIQRDVWENGRKAGSKLEVGIEGEGNDEILRNFGVGIKKDANGNAIGVHKVWIVREGDEYQEGYYNGLQYQPPMWKPRLLKLGERKGRVLKVVYPIEKTDGSVEFYSADREDLQPIILKHIEQNLTSYRRSNKEDFNKLMRELRDLTFDEIIDKYGELEIQFTAYNKTNNVKVISESYTGSTGEAMLIRKLRNIAVRTFPKNFDTTVVSHLYEETFEEKYDKPLIQEVVEQKIETEIEEKAGSVEIDLTPKSKKSKQSTPINVEKQQEVVEIVEIKEEKGENYDEITSISNKDSDITTSNHDDDNDIDDDLDDEFFND